MRYQRGPLSCQCLWSCPFLWQRFLAGDCFYGIFMMMRDTLTFQVEIRVQLSKLHSMLLRPHRGQVHQATERWWGAGLADVDQLMDPLALMSEVLVRGKASPWARCVFTMSHTWVSSMDRSL